MTTYINLYGGPGTGKSTTAAGLFHYMKLMGLKCELITEFAKDLAYEDRIHTDQLLIFSEQYARMARVKDKVDYAISDSPLLLSHIYAKGTHWENIHFHELVRYANDFLGHQEHIFLKRIKPYHRYGRVQTERQAIELDTLIQEMLNDEVSCYYRVEATDTAPYRILEALDLPLPGDNN